MRDATHGKYQDTSYGENVPGAFSSNHGEDFSKAVLEAVIGIKEPGAQVPMPDKKTSGPTPTCTWESSGRCVPHS